MSIDAMKQALEALDNWCDLERSYNERNLILDSRDAITSLRAAIEAAERQEPIGVTDDYGNPMAFRNGEEEGKFPARVKLFTTSQPAIPAWQPIETAPRDGTLILLCRVHPNPDIRIAVSDGQWLEIRNGRWDWVWPYIRKEPTHWMPLPAAPKVPK